MSSSATTRLSHTAILQLLQKPGYTPMTLPEIAAELGLRGSSRKQLAGLLNQMTFNGDIVMIRRNRYSMGEPADLVTGVLEMARSGDAWLTDVEGDIKVRIPRGEADTALPGDRVTVRLLRETGLPGKARMGKVIRVLVRGRGLVLGTLEATGHVYYVVPMDPSYQQHFYVPGPAGAQLKDRVVVQFTNWENRHVNPEGEIIEVIGPVENPSLDTLAVIRHYGLAEDFPEEVLREAERVGGRLGDRRDREDLRGQFIITIDPATAKDFDDALSLEINAAGQRVLGVHIADVSHFVTPGSALDKEALQRGNSVYLPDKVLPMLPEQLSNGLCSLKPDQDRLTFSVFMTFDDQGRCLQSRCVRSVIRSKCRLTYEQAMATISLPEGMRPPAGITPETVSLIKAINELSQTLRRRRMAQWALDIDMPEFDVVMGPDGMIQDIRRAVNDLSHQLVEECMVAANEAVDRELTERGGGVLIHRLHEPPAEEKIADLTAELRILGYHPGNLKQRRNLSDFLKTVRNTPLAYHAQVAVLRSMKRAVYSAEHGGHFGLAKKFYTHFTSPIRRYADLVIHRLLAAALTQRKRPYEREALREVSEHCSMTEQTAEQAERDLVEIKKYRFLAQKLEQGTLDDLEAAVVKVTNFGLFVELLELQIQGLVHISTLSDRFVRFDPSDYSLRAGHEVYRTGSRVKVRVARVDFEKRRIDFVIPGLKASPAGGGNARGGQRRTSGPERRKGPHRRRRS